MIFKSSTIHLPNINSKYHSKWLNSRTIFIKIGERLSYLLHVTTQQCFQRFYQIRQENEVPSINIGKESIKLLFPDSLTPPPHPFGSLHAKYLKIIV